MGAQWKPGDVAVATVEGVPGVVVLRRDGDWAYPMQARGSRGYTCASDSEGLVADVRPLVVIDPAEVMAGEFTSEFAGANSLAQLLANVADYLDAEDVPVWVSVLRALAVAVNPTPPRPVEPTGRFAEVVDEGGEHWFRLYARQELRRSWAPDGDFGDFNAWRGYEDIAVVDVLSEGVTA
jgi:hypothetical protein